MNKKLIMVLMSFLMTITFAMVPFHITNVKAAALTTPTMSGIIVPHLIVDNGASFTLIGDEKKIFDNTLTTAAITYGVTEALTLIANRAKVLGPWATKGATFLSGFVAAKVSANQKVYVRLRQGISWNSTYNYYSYVNSEIFYLDGNFITPTEVRYYDTIERVPDDVCRKYGLNPNP